MNKRCPHTLDIEGWLADHPPPEIILPGVPAELSRRNSFYARHIGVLKLAVDGRDRAQVAEDMSRFLGDDTVTENYLNAALSEARDTHILNSVRYGALVAITRDPRLVALYADLIDHVVMPSALVPYIRMGVALHAKDEAERNLRLARRAAGGRP